MEMSDDGTTSFMGNKLEAVSIPCFNFNGVRDGVKNIPLPETTPPSNQRQ